MGNSLVVRKKDGRLWTVDRIKKMETDRGNVYVYECKRYTPESGMRHIVLRFDEIQTNLKEGQLISLLTQNDVPVCDWFSGQPH